MFTTTDAIYKSIQKTAEKEKVVVKTNKDNKIVKEDKKEDKKNG